LQQTILGCIDLEPKYIHLFRHSKTDGAIRRYADVWS